MYYRNAAAAIIVYSVTNRETFDNVNTWLSSLRENIPDPLVIVLAGNKSDLVDGRVIEAPEGGAMADSVGAQFLEVSALANRGIDDLFLTVAAKCVELAASKKPQNLCPPIEQPCTVVEKERPRWRLRWC
jgi:Ras-related protein Rab-21